MITPIILFLLIVLVGNVLGNVRVKGISLGVSMVLLTAIAVGYGLLRCCPSILTDDFKNTITIFSKIGTVLFVSAIGLSAGSSLARGSAKNNVICFLIGSAMSVSGFLLTRLIGLLDRKIDLSLLWGILCGALTSTPGLSSVCESENMSAELATMGYGAAYFLGVIGAVLFVQRQAREYMVQQRHVPENEPEKMETYEVLMPLCLVGVLGQWLGVAQVPYTQWALGNTGGLLVCGIVIGFLIYRFRGKKVPETTSLKFFREFGINLFFVGTGIGAGQKLNSHLEVNWFFYGALITATTLVLGYLLCRCALKNERTKHTSVIAGGMTSSPAFGALLKGENLFADAAAYSLAYLGALTTLVVMIRATCS